MFALNTHCWTIFWTIEVEFFEGHQFGYSNFNTMDV